MTKKEILKITLEDIRYWAILGKSEKSLDKKAKYYTKCSTLSCLLISMDIITMDKSDILDKIYYKIIYGYDITIR